MHISLQAVKNKVAELEEFNPMLGHRGCRLGNTYPEITEMQTRAIIEAALNLKQKGIDTHVEIMIPLVGMLSEFDEQERVIRNTADKVFEERKDTINYLVGTMIEIPRAVLVADLIAKHADFFSFGTNDLTQMTFGYSRDDVGKFLPTYLEKGILAVDPFEVLDQEGVGQLLKMGIEKGRSIKPDLKIGLCGEHGGEPSSIEFCFNIGLNYVSCSPYRVPIARLASAQAAINSNS
jgi:pyruvate,orthophosphate dikinase